MRRLASNLLSHSLRMSSSSSSSSKSLEAVNLQDGTPGGTSALLQRILAFQPSLEKVVDFVQPVELEEELRRRMEEPQNDAQLGDTAEFVLRRAVNTSHPLFLNQLYGGVHPTGFAAAVIAEKMNTNAHTYEVAPVFVLAERIVLRECRRVFYGREEGDGVFSPGGSISNMYGFVLARHAKFPDVKNHGLFGLPPLVIFTSADSHYSVSKAANWMGLGLANVVKVETSKEGAMIPAALSAAIDKAKEEGKVPLAVNATAGTTVLGAFDDLNAIADICEAEGIWLHCDAAWGGSFVFSEKLRARWLGGIERCDSIAWNAHKMLGAPLQCSVFVTKGAESLSASNSLNASYLFHPDKFYPLEFDRNGDKSVQCGRKGDAFKLWFMWAALGTQGFSDIVETAEAAAAHFAGLVKGRNDFLLYLDSHQCTNVFFWYLPPRLVGGERDAAWWTEIGEVTRRLKERMVVEGSAMVGYAPLPHKNVPNALRLVVAGCPGRSAAHMETLLHKIVALGKGL